MRTFYLVQKNNLKFVPNITKDQIEIWSEFSNDNYYKYIYICIDYNDISHMRYSDYSFRYLINNDFIYMGELMSLQEIRKQKLEKLNEI